MTVEFDMQKIDDTLNDMRLNDLGEYAAVLGGRFRRVLHSKDAEIARLRGLFGPKAQDIDQSKPDTDEKFEASPRKSPLEKVLCRLSICTTTREPTGSTGVAEITEAEFAGMIAGMDCGGDRLLRELAELMAWAYLDYPDAMNKLTIHLDTWGRQRVLFQRSELNVSGVLHRKVMRAVVRRHIRRDFVGIEQFWRLAGLSERRWPAWRKWVDIVTKRMAAAETTLAQHLSDQLRASDKMSNRDFQQTA